MSTHMSTHMCTHMSTHMSANMLQIDEEAEAREALSEDAARPVR